MIATFVAALSFSQPIRFGAFPIYTEEKKGYRMADKKHSFETVYGDDRVPVGWWNDGAIAQPLEWVTWISPSLISRWLGYLDRRELWTGNDLAQRYQVVSNALDGKLTFLVQLIAFPKQSLLEITEPAPPTPKEIERVRFMFTVDGKRMTPTVTKLAFWQTRERGIVNDYRWWQDVPWGSALNPEWMSDRIEPLYMVGDHYAAWYLVQVPSLPEIFACESFELRIISPRKERIGIFPKPKIDFKANFRWKG